jgi:steroid 5-alpha reductase family enzyme
MVLLVLPSPHSGYPGGPVEPWMESGLEGLALVGAGAYVLWLVSLTLRDASIADRFWGLGFVLLAAWYAAGGTGWPLRSYLVLALTAAWGIRLSVHIHLRNRGKPEDPRYARWRDAGGASYWWISLFRVFLLQALILWLVSAPLLAAQSGATPDRLTALDVGGAALWLVGFLFEVVGDAQLARFRRDPANAGRVLSTGLWRYTRHPNYFGDALIWWGFFLIAASVPGGWWTVFSPLLMTLLLVRVSGVTLLESGMRETRPGYADYVARTSAFIPWPPRRSGPDAE